MQSVGRIILIDVKEKKTLVTSKWTFHTGRIAALSFSPTGKRLASAGADESIYVWEVEKTLKNTPIKVSTSYFARLAWLKHVLLRRMLILEVFRVSLGKTEKGN